MLRRLRIAASVFFAVVAVALIVLWVRSYQINEAFSRVDSNLAPQPPGFSNLEVTAIGLSKGRIYVSRRPVHSSVNWVRPHGWKYNSVQLSNLDLVVTEKVGTSSQKWLPLPYISWLPSGFCVRPSGVCAPLSSLVFVSLVAAALPWLPTIMSKVKSPPRRFSLRTMLIATTLVAVVLGLVMWAASRV